MSEVNTTMSPNSGASSSSSGGSGGDSVVGSGGGVSAQKVVEVLAKILTKQNKDFDTKLKAAEAADNKQQNVEMLKVQQAMGAVNTTQSAATACIQGLTDAQKETARASR
ncbi:hypothetical protein [Caballeronia sordidicola]|jgi:hypothetical protein|uniref:Uncharacterized protein n=1 Tax=Caballeronia sordidicola TaxID=196367 RepID=A0A226X0J3_CABSO|nr:hypothetical protein [Caballeronia sordidicola]OXC76944.1 hypothetical protein BSU04_18205 [Caballeronia sordidicola]